MKVFCPNVCTSSIIYNFFAFYHVNFFKPKLQKIFFYKKDVYLGENTLIHCSQRTVVHVYVNAFL